MEKEIELLPCPFCGALPIKEYEGSWLVVTCSDDRCVLGNMAITTIGWNRRPTATATATTTAREARLVEALEQEVYRLNNHDMHLDIGGMAEDVAVQCPVCEACERIWAIIHPEDINTNGDEK